MIYTRVRISLAVALVFCGYHAFGEWRLLRINYQRQQADHPGRSFKYFLWQNFVHTLQHGAPLPMKEGGPILEIAEVPSFWQALFKYFKEGEDALKPLPPPTHLAYPITSHQNSESVNTPLPKL